MGLRKENLSRDERVRLKQEWIQVEQQKAIKKEIKRLEKSKYGSRENIFYLPHVSHARKKKPITSPKQQMELFFGWLKHVSDKRTRVLGKAFILNDLFVERVPVLEQYEIWKATHELAETFNLAPTKYDYDFSKMTEEEVQLLHQQEEEKWQHVEDLEVYGLFEKYDDSMNYHEFYNLFHFLHTLDNTKEMPEKRYKNADEYYADTKVREAAINRLNSFEDKTEVQKLIESGKYELRLIKTSKRKLINAFITKFYSPKYFMRMINANTVNREDQYFLTSVVYKKKSETVDANIRRLDRVTEFPLLFSEIDYYKVPAFQNMEPQKVVQLIEAKLKYKEFPLFSEVIYSGQGIHLYWKINPIGQMNAAKWKFMQNFIYELLKEFGADANAKDGVRVMRLIGSINHKNGKVVTGETYSNERISFEALFDEYCAEDYRLMQLDVQKKKLEASQRQYERLDKLNEWMLKKGLIDENGNYTDKYDSSKRNPSKSIYHRHHQLVLNDLMTLVTLRNGLMEGYRNTLFFIFYNYALRVYSTTEEAQDVMRDLYNLLTDVEFSFEKYVYHAKSAEKAHEEWLKNPTKGYNYKPSRLIELFDITEVEMQSLFTLVTDEIKHENRKVKEKERITTKRRQKGVKSHSELKEETLKAILKARDTLIVEGKKTSNRAIAKIAGVSEGTVRNYLK